MAIGEQFRATRSFGLARFGATGKITKEPFLVGSSWRRVPPGQGVPEEHPRGLPLQVLCRTRHIEPVGRKGIMKTRTKLVRTAVLFLLIASGVCGLGYWWVTGSHRAQCSLQLSNYNQCVASCGMDSYAETWKNPKKTEELVWRLFRMRIPECPSGGQYSLVYNRGAHAWLPKLICLYENSREHICRGIEHDENQANIKAEQ